MARHLVALTVADPAPVGRDTVLRCKQTTLEMARGVVPNWQP
ncbi:hypothetical protein [Ferribacterium limneticum]|nr:hypothetical protein [Ferribacterium limneticum]